MGLNSIDDSWYGICVVIFACLLFSTFKSDCGPSLTDIFTLPTFVSDVWLDLIASIELSWAAMGGALNRDCLSPSI